jgi:hypothetical protein
MTRGKFKKHVGPQPTGPRKRSKLVPTTGPTACWRSVDIKLPCATCGGKTSPMHSPTRRAGIWCASCCPCCNPTVASTVPAPGKPLQAPVTLAETRPLPEGRGAVLGQAGARGKGFNRPFGKRFDKYLGTF